MGRPVQFGIRALLITAMFCAAIGAVYSFQIREAAKEKHELARVVAFDEFTDHCLAVNDRIKPKLKQFLNEEEHFPKPSKGHIAGGVTVTSFEFSSSEESSGRLRIEYNWQDSSQPRNQPSFIWPRVSRPTLCTSDRRWEFRGIGPIFTRCHLQFSRVETRTYSATSRCRCSPGRATLETVAPA